MLGCESAQESAWTGEDARTLWKILSILLREGIGRMRTPRIGYTAKILIGLLAGIAFGLFFGESCSILQPLSQAFIKVLQITVFPYIVVNLISSLGSMREGEARITATKGGVIMLIFWAFGAISIAFMRFAIPDNSRPSFFTSSKTIESSGFDLIEAFIPYNPFHSLAEGQIPAIVLFSLLVGVALIGMRKKKALIAPLDIISLALSRISGLVQVTVPIGVFVSAAYTAGTISLNELLEIQVFLITSAIFSLLIVLFAVPLLISSVTPFSCRDILSSSSSAVILGATTTSSFIALPLVIEGVQNLFNNMERNNGLDRETEIYSKALAPIAYSFPTLGSFMAIFFVFFAAWFYMNPMQTADSLKLIVIGIPSVFGHTTVAVPFLLDVMHLPSDAMVLYLNVLPIYVNFLMALVTMSIFSYMIVSVAALTNQTCIKWRRLLLSVLLILSVYSLVVMGLHSGFASMLDKPQEREEMVEGMSMPKTTSTWLADSRIETVIYKNPDEVPRPRRLMGENALERIQKSGTLRVGYIPNIIAFSFFNHSGSLVGYDVQMAYDLSRFLGVSRLEFIPVNYRSLADDLEQGRCDIIMSAVSATPERLMEMDLTRPYMELHPAFVVQDWRRNEFKSLNEVQSMSELRVAALRGSEDIKTAKMLFPNAIIIEIDSYEEFFKGGRGDALFDTAEEGAALALLNPYYSAVMFDSGDLVIDSYTYPIARSDSQTLLYLLDYWLSLEELHGGLKEKYDYWILGKSVLMQPKRWCVARDILHWIS